MLTYILIVVLLYVLLFILNTNHLEKKIFYKHVMNGGIKNFFGQSQYQTDVGTGVKQILLAPFYFDDNRLTKISQGTMFNLYCFTDEYIGTQGKMSGKMFWDDYFNKNGIKTPKLYATTNPFRVYDHILPDKEYIAKPEIGFQGRGVHVIKGRDIKPTKDNYLIQEKVQACDYDGALSYRVVTTYDGDVVTIYEQKNDKNVTSNSLNGFKPTETKIRLCGTSMCEDVKDKDKLNAVIDKLKNLHTRDFSFCFSIGWDLMIDCDHVYVLEGNWPSAIFGRRPDADEFLNDVIKPKVEKFYALNNM
jgi:hypothetical protein